MRKAEVAFGTFQRLLPLGRIINDSLLENQ